MNVLLDYWIFDHVATGGIYRYFYNLIKESKKQNELQYAIGCLLGNGDEDLKELNLRPQPFNKSKNKTVRRASKIVSRSLNATYSALTTLISQYDILHPTYYSTSFISQRSRPLAITVYDMIHELFPQFMHKGDPTSKNKKILCDKADIIFAISETTKSDLIRLFNIPADKIKVTHLAGGFAYQHILDTLVERLPKKYLLFIGHRDGYKNFDRFFKACVPILQQDDSLSILCTGRPFTLKEISLFNSYNLGNRIFHHFALENEFYTIYSKAEAMIFPSLYEGFGIPILEAFASDCPVVMSQSGSLAEIGTDAAMYFDPYSEFEINKAVSQIIYDQGLRQKCIESGKKRLQDFGWEKTYQSTLDGYLTII